MSQPPIVDLHEDLLPHILAAEGNDAQTGWRELAESPVRVVVASTWPGYASPDVIGREALSVVEGYMHRYSELHDAGDASWRIVATSADLEASLAPDGARGLVVHVEGIGHRDVPVEELLERWYGYGCRSVGIVWNVPNGLASGPAFPRDGLTAEGRRAVRWLDRNPVVLDLAHMSVASFWDTVATSAGPLLASHANARALCDHPRNLDDDQLRAVAERDGVVGIVLCAPFVGTGAEATVARAVDHVEHVLEVAGARHAAIGTDFGGVAPDDRLPGLDRVGRIGALVDEMGARGMDPELIEAVAWRNAARVIAASLDKGAPPA